MCRTLRSTPHYEGGSRNDFCWKLGFLSFSGLNLANIWVLTRLKPPFMHIPAVWGPEQPLPWPLGSVLGHSRSF